MLQNLNTLDSNIKEPSKRKWNGIDSHSYSWQNLRRKVQKLLKQRQFARPSTSSKFPFMQAICSGVTLVAEAFSRSAWAALKVLAISLAIWNFSFLAATIKGVCLLRRNSLSKSAFAKHRARTTAICPFKQAIYKGVALVHVGVLLTSALALHNTFTTSTNPFAAAK